MSSTRRPPSQVLKLQELLGRTPASGIFVQLSDSQQYHFYDQFSTLVTNLANDIIRQREGASLNLHHDTCSTLLQALPYCSAPLLSSQSANLGRIGRSLAHHSSPHFIDYKFRVALGHLMSGICRCHPNLGTREVAAAETTAETSFRLAATSKEVRPFMAQLLGRTPAQSPLHAPLSHALQDAVPSGPRPAA